MQGATWEQLEVAIGCRKGTSEDALGARGPSIAMTTLAEEYPIRTIG